MRLWGESMRLTLVWNKGMLQSKRKKLAEVQDYVDKKALQLMIPYVPVARPFWHNAGKLRDSARIAEPGRIEFTAPFARDDYYARKNHKERGGNPNGRRLWFEYMKVQDGQKILMGARRIIGK